MLVDCRSLIEFCKAFEQHRSMANSLPLADQPSLQHKFSNSLHARSKKQAASPQSSSPPICKQSSAAAVDIVILLLVLGACGFLFTPYFKYMCTEGAEILPITLLLIGELLYQCPLAYIVGTLLTLAIVVSGLEFYQYRSRKCDNPRCRGLRKALEFDIQLESEHCVKSAPPVAQELPLQLKCGVELGEDHKELEAELRRLAPPNGRAVLIFRARCGCPAGRMEVWGAKKLRKTKK